MLRSKTGFLADNEFLGKDVAVPDFSPQANARTANARRRGSSSLSMRRPVRDLKERPQSIIHRFRVRERRRYFGLEQNHVNTPTIAVRVFAPNTAREIVLGPHLRRCALRTTFLRSCVFHVVSQCARQFCEFALLS